MIEQHYTRVARWGGLAAATVGALGLVGRVTGTMQFTGAQAATKPMAAWVSIVFILLGLSLAALVSRKERRGVRVAVTLASVLVLTGSLVSLGARVAGSRFDLDRTWPFGSIVRLGIEERSTTPLGPPAIGAASLALLLLAARRARPVASTLAVAAALTGFTICIGYLYPTPLVPTPGWHDPSLLGGVGTLLLGIAMVAAAGPQAWPLRLATGPSVQAMLVRWLTPLIVLVVVVTDLMTVHLFTLSHALGSVLNTALSVGAGLAVVYAVSRTIGRRLDRADAIEAQLRQSQKMEAVGQLAGGIAHDFNNLLTAIRGYAEFVIEALDPGDRRRADTEQIAGAADRAAQLTHQLLAFSRRQPLDPRVIDANGVVARMEKLLLRLIGVTVRLRVKTAPGVLPVRMDAGQLEQVVMNLVVNARDAMPEGGTVVAETAVAEFEEAVTWGGGEIPAGRYVGVTVSDTGMGMNREIQERLFEPFFTTKEPGRGTGLGLSTVFGIVRQNGGGIVVFSEPGRGATFRVYLPWSGEPVSQDTTAALPAGSINGQETVLVVDDDAQVRALAERVFRAYGYRVLLASSGEEAIGLASQAVDLLVTDLVLPRMQGRELVERIVALSPNASVLCVTGYDSRVVEQGIPSGTVILQKPFTPRALVRAARDVLDRRAADVAGK